jgi:hypothetical protein
MRKRFAHAPDTEEHRSASRALDAITERIRRRTPDDRDKRRMEMFYVDMLGNDEWSRPCEVAGTLKPAEALQEINGAVNDYSLVLHRLLDGVDENRTVTVVAALSSLRCPRYQ